ncbi:hypothetical protein, partial [Klebsiella pneumoniae]|uniref:hypothetical protein n=1 Tax=Klebsiella pneumoniae TaxID=573 RepID=UPI00396902DF
LIGRDMRRSRCIDGIKSLKAGDLKKEEIKFTPSEYMVSSSGFIADNPKTIADFMTVFSTQYESEHSKYDVLR